MTRAGTGQSSEIEALPDGSTPARLDHGQLTLDDPATELVIVIRLHSKLSPAWALVAPPAWMQIHS
ncbi:hypothetical protein [Pseudonocardia asaccharolytica]|uniref:Uncharacterized protein n=1 Tax=Pseudonocardia asaccharolytica DSM 44247 = NBRC 16224 TaxID=1123024 RepID=A0A511D271_9PSEU|nr:hypothetical protein [Pseudonocardia asaccharolytica]GEL18882.1 hypothetical protein PA7_27190 [Pseudonocardia asaccharolytica DSM 44247 = NBRC 16224]